MKDIPTKNTHKNLSSLCRIASVAHDISLPFTMAKNVKSLGSIPIKNADEKLVWNACLVNCGGRCPLECHVTDGVVTSITTDHAGEDTLGDHQVRACLRGRVR